MARRRRKDKPKSYPFTRVPATWPRYLHEAGVSATEVLVLIALAQHPQRNGLLSRPVADYGSDHDSEDRTGIATATGLRNDQVCRALSSLCTKRHFTLPDGTTTTVLTPKVKGHRGRVAVYRCNLPSDDGNQSGEKAWHDSHSKPQKKYGSSANTVLANQPYHLEKSGVAGSKPSHPPTLLR